MTTHVKRFFRRSLFAFKMAVLMLVTSAKLLASGISIDNWTNDVLVGYGGGYVLGTGSAWDPLVGNINHNPATQVRTLLKFNIASISGTVSTATLTLTPWATENGSPQVIALGSYNINGAATAFGAGGETANTNLVNSLSDTTLLGSFSVSTAQASARTPFTLDVTKPVAAAQASGQTYVSFVLWNVTGNATGATGDEHTYFLSKNGAAGGPSLNVTTIPADGTGKDTIAKASSNIDRQQSAIVPVKTFEIGLESTNDIASGASMLGGTFCFMGIEGVGLFVGNPNQLARADRVVMTFNLASLINRTASVKSAKLLFYEDYFFGPGSTRDLELSVFERQLDELSEESLSSGEVKIVSTVSISSAQQNKGGSTKGKAVSLDVTKQVLDRIKSGRTNISFRLRDVKVEAEGNSEREARGITLDKRPGMLPKIQVELE